MDTANGAFWLLFGIGYFVGQVGYVLYKYNLFTRAARKVAAGLATKGQA